MQLNHIPNHQSSKSRYFHPPCRATHFHALEAKFISRSSIPALSACYLIPLKAVKIVLSSGTATVEIAMTLHRAEPEKSWKCSYEFLDIYMAQ